MSNMKCPFCQQELECCRIYIDGTKKLWCDNCKLFGDNRLFEKLIRTRKTLYVALCSLQDIAESNGDFITGDSTPLDEHEYADMMLKEIKRQMKIKMKARNLSRRRFRLKK